MSVEVLQEKVKKMEQRQGEFVLREVYEIFVEDFKQIKSLVHQNRNTQLKLVGALIAFKVIYAPLVFVFLQYWLGAE